jgi:hypothetical protein
MQFLILYGYGTGEIVDSDRFSGKFLVCISMKTKQFLRITVRKKRTTNLWATNPHPSMGITWNLSNSNDSWTLNLDCISEVTKWLSYSMSVQSRRSICNDGWFLRNAIPADQTVRFSIVILSSTCASVMTLQNVSWKLRMPLAQTISNEEPTIISISI